MTHLSRTEFVDLLESSSALPAARVEHAETCDACRAQLRMLRESTAAALEDAAAEPSPLFWDHFSARVAAAVREEPLLPVRTSWRRPPMLTWATAASIALLLVAVTVWRTTLHAPAPRQIARPPAADVMLAAPLPADDADDDEAWAVVRAAAVDLSWDDVHAAGITAHPGDLENVALELTAEERVELARLVNQDLKRNGA